MANAGRSGKAAAYGFPVWVGSLSENVTEELLRRQFSRFGNILSVKIMWDKAAGRSKGFGYVNFHTSEAAELSAAKMAGANLLGCAIKTQGPRELEKKGLFSPPAKGPSIDHKIDYRPLTDCTFFIQGRKCTKGGNCVYRHSEKALQTQTVCPGWKERSCLNRNCPRRHPPFSATRKSNSSSVGSPPLSPEPVGGEGGVGVLVCGGKCGDVTCSLSFSSPVTLTQHIQLSQLLSTAVCTACNIVCSSQAELREHEKMCPRTHRDSGSTSAPSISDVEVLTDTSESLPSEDEDGGGGGGGGLFVTPQKQASYYPTTSGAKKGGAGSNKKERGGSAGGGGARGGKKKKNKGGIPSPKSATNLASTDKTQTKTKMRKASSEAFSLGASSDYYFLQPNLTHDPSDAVLLDDEGENQTNVSFGVGSDSSDSSDDEEYDNLEYSPAEMAQLLSLNELDMQPGSDDSEAEEEEEQERERNEAGVKKRQRHRSRRKTNEPESPPSPGPKTSSAQKQPKKERKYTAVHMRQPEPVGLFWDIENCSVPVNKSAFAVAAKMRRVFFEGKREAEFMVVCDITKERKEIVDALNKAQVTLVHVNAVAKNAADDKLRQSLRRFALTYPAPSTVILVSSDVNFSSELNDLRHVHNMTIVLVHSRATSDALKVFAQQLVSYEQFLEDVEGPKRPQQQALPNILLVTNLPKNLNPKKLSNRLGQLSDNCGGRVLSVNSISGTAHILFRTHDWAVKAEKRMKGENVFGSKINLCLDYTTQQRPPPQNHQTHHPLPPPPPRPPPPSSQFQTRPPHPHPPPPRPQGFPPPQFHRPPHPGPPTGPPTGPPAGLPGGPPRGLPGGPHPTFHHLSGPALGNTFPPANRSPPAFPPSPPLLHGPVPRPGGVPPPLSPNHPQNFPLLRGPPLPMSPRGPPQPRFTPPQPPRVPPPVTTYSNVAAIPPPRPEGKILIIKIPATDEPDMFPELKRQALMITLEANIKMEQESPLVLWHSFSELQLLLKIDFHGTAVVRKEDLIRNMWDKGDLQPKFAEKFVQQCAKSLEDVCQHQGLTWQVNPCGWSRDEEEDRLIKSQVIDLLRRFPHCWMKWTRFKKKYNECYHSALSEMAVHTCCKGVVMILGKPDNNQSQVIIRYEMSPLVRILGQKKVVTTVQNKVVDMISARPEQKIKLLDVVREYTKEMGDLPLSSSGKPLQEVLTCPRLRFTGTKPSSIFLTLAPLTKPKPPPSPPSPSPLPLPTPPEKTTVLPSQRGGNNTPGDLMTLSAEFRHLLKKQSPPYEMPLSRLQQEYQTLYHQSIKVSDYISTVNGEGSKMRALVDACSGIGLKEVRLSNTKTETIVYLESEKSTAAAVAASATAAVSTASTSKAQTQAVLQPAPPDTVADCERRVRYLLCGLPGYQISLDRFVVEYERKYGHKMSYYGHSKLTGLLETFTSTLVLSEGKGPTRIVQLRPLVVLDHELSLLLSANGGQLPINNIVPAYKEKFGKNLNVLEFGFNKLIKALEALQDSISLVGVGASRVAVLKQPLAFLDPAAVDQFKEDVSLLLFSNTTKKKSMAVLTSNYNEVFRGPATAGKLSPITVTQMANTVEKLPCFNVTGTGPTQYVSLVQQPTKKKEKNKPPQKATSEPLEPVTVTNTKPTFTGEATAGIPKRSETLPPPLLPLIPPPPPQSLNDTIGLHGNGGERENLVVRGGVLQDATGSSEGRSGEDSSALLRFNDRESQRLTSETQRLLVCHPEHSMTISELVQSYKEGGDPAEPTLEELSLCLHKHNVKKGNSKLFQISSIPRSLGDSLIQLNRADCIAKFGHDLIYLFVVQPTPQMDLSLLEIEALYQKCYGRRLNPGVYGMRTLQGLIEGEGHLSLRFKLDETKQVCSLADLGFQRVMSSLLIEVLYLRAREGGEQLDHLPLLFQQHFGFHLPLKLRGLETLSSLLNLKEIQSHFQVNDGRVLLKDVDRFSEELRFLLTRHNGRISLHSLPNIYQSTFGSPPPEREGKIDWLKKKLILYAPHIVNLTGNQWVIWAPAGRPYPPRPRSKLASSRPIFPAHNASLQDLVEAEEARKGVRVNGEDPLVKTSSTHSSMHPATTNNIGPYTSQPEEPKESQSSELSSNPLYLFAVPLNPNTPKENLPAIFSPPTNSEPPPPAEDLIVFDDSPYGFLERDPDLLAQLTIKEEDEENTVSTEEALQRLIEAGNSLHDLPPPLLPSSYPPQPQPQPQPHPHTSCAGSDRETPSSVKDNSFSERLNQDTTDHFKLGTNPDEGTTGNLNTGPNPNEGATDYLKAGLNPDQVLQELYRVKDQGGGVINPASMAPFLDYFGELSSRELERIESLEASKAEKPFSPTPSKGLRRNKQKMAIRFPGQDSEIDPELQKALSSVHLPEIPDDSSEDDGDSSLPVRPISRDELIEQLLNGNSPLSPKEGEEEEEENII